ncbi:uroporphyrinogen-III synthase [Thauera phenolivorans]|uniref:uroporphyrinogen-III synthase n=1 Tax=Thauera phenolivorans TaxID=1792543 RepID=UPI0009F73179|nr:uroporphyrinogen-III synthase [Thauera phenolivorans]
MESESEVSGVCRPLAGRRLVVTRPAAQADSLCEAIAAAGGEAVRLPVLAIGPAPDPRPLEVIADRLEEFDLAFFVSPNAVQYALENLLARRSWPASLRVATVGKGSERALAGFGFTQVIAPGSGFDSEAVLQLPEFSAGAVAGRRVLIFRGDGGRDLLAETLRSRGASVEFVPCYRRGCPALDPTPLIEAARRGGIDGLLLTSSEGVDNLVRMLGEAGMEVMREVTVFASHPRIAARALAAGFRAVVETPAGDQGLMQTLVQRFG